MRAEFLLILSAFLHSTWNFIFKRTSPKDSVLLVIVSVSTLFSVLMTPWMGGWEVGSLLGFTFTVIAGFFEAGYFISLSKAYENSAFGITYSIMRGGAMVLVAIISVLFLNEPLSWLKFIGLSLLGVGLFLTPSKDKDPLSRHGLYWALSCSFFIAGYHIFYGFALGQGVSQVSLFVLSMLTSLPFLALKSNSEALKSLKRIPVKDYGWIVFAGAVSGGSFILFLYGLKESHPGVAISLRNTSIVFSQGFALLWLKEKLTRRQWFGIFGIAIGAMMITQ